MNIHRVPPAWRLPEGVDVPLWEYLHTPRLAVEEDAYFAGHPLFEADTKILHERFKTPGRLVDLGCGAGRHAVRFASLGFQVMAIDLSHPMLQTVQHKTLERDASLLPMRANLCHLEMIPNDTFDYALSMFSTVGMIRSRPARKRALAEACRILRPGGRLAIHLHNLWLNLRDPQGRRWLLSQFFNALTFRPGFGDRSMTYRGIPHMEVHLYRWGELARELRQAGFRIDEVISLEDRSYRPISHSWLLPRFRAGGWIVFARKPSS